MPNGRPAIQREVGARLQVQLLRIPSQAACRCQLAQAGFDLVVVGPGGRDVARVGLAGQLAGVAVDVARDACSRFPGLLVGFWSKTDPMLVVPASTAIKARIYSQPTSYKIG